jgi:hypothetical protein
MVSVLHGHVLDIYGIGIHVANVLVQICTIMGSTKNSFQAYK